MEHIKYSPPGLRERVSVINSAATRHFLTSHIDMKSLTERLPQDFEDR